MALLATICFLGIACTEAPMDPGELAGPEFAKGGKGKPTGDPPINVTFQDSDGDNIRSDGLGIYEDGVCNVDATFNLNDARLNLKGRIKKKDQATCGGPRFIEIAFTDRVVGSPPGGQDGNVVQGRFMNVDGVENVTGGPVQKHAIFHMPGCALGLNFNPDRDPDSNKVNVTKNPDGTWTVATQPSPNDVAVCIPEEQNPDRQRSYYHMPFSITVTLK
jgi:hypothetical protein